MPIVNKSNLQFSYQWNAIPPDDPRITGAADSIFLNRQEGYEVLAFLNRISKEVSQALKAERLIRNHLPGSVRSRANVLNWLQSNWNSYS